MAAPIRKQHVDYSVYLVTDSSPGILGTVRDLCEDVVAPAVASGVTCVQYREKKADTNAMVAMGRRLHAVTRARGVPLLINDRVDVALAVGCEGVHIGQDDMGELFFPFFPTTVFIVWIRRECDVTILWSVRNIRNLLSPS